VSRHLETVLLCLGLGFVLRSLSSWILAMFFCFGFLCPVVFVVSVQ